MKTITFVTSNPHKAAQLGWHLNVAINHIAIELPELQSLDINAVISHKALAAFNKINSPVLVEDTALIYNALGKLPGPFIKWFYEELGNDGLCRILNTAHDRSAVAIAAFAYYDGKQLKLFRGEMNGTISRVPLGEVSFGWDPIFIPDGSDKTWGQMSKDEQIETSVRRIALKKFEAFITKNSQNRH